MLTNLRSSWPGLLNEFLKNDSLVTFLDESGSYKPAVNIMETEESYFISVAAPGFQKSDLNVNLENRVLTISSEKDQNGEEGKYLRKEFGFVPFKRSFTLPESSDTEKIKAEHVNGLLNLYIPKKEEAKVKPARLIAIN